MTYWKIGALLALLAAAFSAGWYFSGLSGRLALETERKQVMADAMAQIEAAQKLAYDADEKLQAALKRQPKTGQTVREVIRNAPSDCTVNADVADRLRDGARAANKATSAG